MTALCALITRKSAMSSSAPTYAQTAAYSLSIAVIGPDDARRAEVAMALNESYGGIPCGSGRPGAERTIEEFCSYPLDLEGLPRMLAQIYDAVFIDLDSDTEHALKLVHSLSAGNSATVMVYSARAGRDLVIRCMRAGAREFLNLPLAPGEMAGALARVPLRDPSLSLAAAPGRKTMVFLGSKGGCGVTTIATSFAVSVAQDSGQSTLLIDLGLPLGDAALHLGMVCDYSTTNALEDWTRLDVNFLRTLLGKHDSGLSVLAAPGEFPRTDPSMQAINRLLAVARQSFQHVIVDIGSRLDLMETALFDPSAHLYLVSQVGISEMRNANRLVTQFFSQSGKLQIVLNRHTSHALGFSDEHVAKVLTRRAHWMIPDDDASGMRAGHAIGDFSLRGSAISKPIRHMARAACGLPTLDEKKRIFSLF
jgi:pilus assembly protein CpaE